MVTVGLVNPKFPIVPSVAGAVGEPETGAARLSSPKSSAKKTKKPAKATVQRSSSTLSQQSIDMANQASMTAKRTLSFEEPSSVPGTSRGPVRGGKLSLMKKGR